MNAYLNPKDIGMSAETPDRANLSVWIAECEGLYFVCALCKHATVARPSLYCANCGALMANREQAIAMAIEYTAKREQEKREQEAKEGADNGNVQGN